MDYEISPELDEQIETTCFALSMSLEMAGVQDNGDTMTLIRRYANLYACVQLARVADAMAREGHYSASQEVADRVRYIGTLRP